MVTAQRIAPWLADFFASWQRYGATHSDLVNFYAILRDLDTRTLRVPRERLAVEATDPIEHAALELWAAWNLFLADDWSHASEKIEAICKKLPDRPEPHIFFAVVQLAQNNRRAGWAGIQRALKSDPSNAALQKLVALLGVRRQPVLKFLDRSNPLNVLLGKIRHRTLGALSLSVRPLF